VSKKFQLTAPQYVWRIVFSTRDLPKLRQSQYLADFPHSAREIWVKQRQIRDLLLAIEPSARWEKHEARRCPRCHRWFVGIEAQRMREREMRARFSGEPLERCGESCMLLAGRWPRKRALGLGVVSKKIRLTAPQYVWHITFFHHDIPQLRQRHWLPTFPHSNREIWVKQRQIRDLLLSIEPEARWEKHEARRCSRCHSWRLGIQAQMMRGREQKARFSGEPLEPCSESCLLQDGGRRRFQKLLVDSSVA
jgi:ssDNA-binding Zn-finger/Zn-ribbon topoisomerase 1